MSVNLKDGGLTETKKAVMTEESLKKAAGESVAHKFSNAGQQLKLAQRVKAALSTYCLHPEPRPLDHDEVVVGIHNRDGAPPNVQYLHHGLIEDIRKNGFCRSRPQEGICIKYTSDAGKKQLIEHNQRFTRGSSMLPPIDESKAVFGSLAGTHLNLGGRCFKAKGLLTLGSVS